MSTFLNLILVLPASSPSPVWKLMLMVGPFCRIDCTASQPPISTATSGTSHTSCTRQRERGGATASGKSGSTGGLSTIGLQSVPDEARVEGHRREHGQHDHRAER